MQIHSNQADFSSVNQAGQLIQLSSVRDSCSERVLQPFVDNLDHIQSLELEAKLMVAVAMIRRGFKIDRKNDDPLEAIFPFLPENANLVLTEELLNTTTEENRLREEQSRKDGVTLNFVDFCARWELDKFEQKVVMLLFMQFSSPDFIACFKKSGLEENCDNGMEIGVILTIITPDLRKQLDCRGYFSVTSSLLKEQILSTNLNNLNDNTSILRTSAYLHERDVRYIIGDNNYYNAAFSFIKQENSAVSLDQVVLPVGLKEDVISTVEKFMACRQNGSMEQLDAFFGYGTGLAILFHGASGTGKTMLAKGLAGHLNRPLFSLNLDDMDEIPMSDDDILSVLFKEAALMGAIVFLDECDDLFSGAGNNRLSRALLMELEKSRCITILATNRPVELDPAIERRLALKVHFTLPDEELRKRMWQALTPGTLPLSSDVDLLNLAKRYLFTGGLIKNCLFMAANSAIAAGSPVITGEMLSNAASKQTVSISDADGICVVHEPHYSIDMLQLRSRQKDELRNTATAWKQLREENLGLNLLINTADIATGVQVAEALASECGMKVRTFDLEKVLAVSEDSRMLDPVTQRKVTPMQYAFSASTGDAAIVLFVDYEGVFDNILEGDEKNYKATILSDLTMHLRSNRGLFCLVTKSMQKRKLPVEFNLQYQLDYPPESLQISSWEKSLETHTVSDDELVTLVEQFPMHIAEIEFIGRQASIKSIILGQGNKPTLTCIRDIINCYRQKTNVSLLFGQGNN